MASYDMYVVPPSECNIPLWRCIPNGLLIGKIIEIRGLVPNGCDVFHIDLAEFRDDGANVSDRPLHISVRPNQKAVVRNTFKDGKWDREERDGGCPFQNEKQFLIFILVEIDGYRIAVDCKHCWFFAHRLRHGTVSMLHINGTVRIDEIRFREPRLERTNVPGTPLPYAQAVIKPVINPPIPYFHTLPDGLKPGCMFFISGRPTTSARRFTINLTCSRSPYPPPEDVAFHFDIRFFNSTLVRNTRVNEKWGKEETLAPFFPFIPGVFFDMILRVENEKFMIAINGQHFLEYRHRIFPLMKINQLHIEADIMITALRFAFI